MGDAVTGWEFFVLVNMLYGTMVQFTGANNLRLSSMRDKHEDSQIWSTMKYSVAKWYPPPSEKKKIYKFMALHSGMEVFLKFRLIFMCSEIVELQSHICQYLNLLNL